MLNNITIYTGLPGTGKTTALINTMEEHQNAGGKVVLFLSSEHEELTRRKNVKPGGRMGCRTPGLSFLIDHVCTTAEAGEKLNDLESGTLVVFDEAHFFQPEVVNSWRKAANEGVKVLVGTPSSHQLERLNSNHYSERKMEVKCECKQATATEVVYKDNMTFPTHLCKKCHIKYMSSEIDSLLADVKASDPFPGELHTYQPFYSLDMPGWKLVRGDSPARLAVIRDAVSRSPKVKELLADPVLQPTFLDLGCCSGFFTDGMDESGFKSHGVDVTKHFIDWASRLSKMQGKAINLTQADAYKFMLETEQSFDVASTFATVQWVMVQKGYETGLECFKNFFAKTNHIAIVEMGYTVEDIYKDKIKGAPGVIDKDWVLELMNEYGDFSTIEVHHAGENGIWRDIFVGFREVPTPRSFRRSFEGEMVSQVSDAMGFSEDRWAAPTFEVFFKANKPIKLVQFQGWRPDSSSTVEGGVSLYLNRKLIAEQSTGRGIFEIATNVVIDEGQVFSIKVECSTTEDVPQDSRELAYLLREITFS